jgi:uncharacterized protein (DUF433 family)
VLGCRLFEASGAVAGGVIGSSPLQCFANPFGSLIVVMLQMQALEKMHSKGREVGVVMNYQDRISIEPGKRGGKPCIRGMRITVYDVLEYLASGMSEREILDDFPDLTQEDIRACLAFAADRERKLVSAIDP